MDRNRRQPVRLRDVRTTVINLSPKAMTTIVTETGARTSPDETGGILLGHDLGDEIQVTVAGDPGPAARHSAARFRRDLAHATRLGEAAWALDRSLWVGDWHTHPNGPPQPSPYDLRTYRHLLREPELSSARFLAVIVIPEPMQAAPELYAWLVTRRRRPPAGLLVTAAAVIGAAWPTGRL